MRRPFDKLRFVLSDISGCIAYGFECKLPDNGSAYKVDTASVYEFFRIFAVIGAFVGIEEELQNFSKKNDVIKTQNWYHYERANAKRRGQSVVQVCLVLLSASGSVCR